MIVQIRTTSDIASAGKHPREMLTSPTKCSSWGTAVENHSGPLCRQDHGGTGRRGPITEAISASSSA